MVVGTINDAVTMAGGEGALLAGRYRIVKPLGQGGMGSVWLAEDSQLDNKLFAIKMLPSILVSNKRAYRQLKEEALVAMRLVHPNIVQIRAFEENGGNPFLVMDYVDGQTLDDYLAEEGNGERGTGNCRARTPGAPFTGGLPEEEVVRILKPIAAALDYAHGEGVVHRDVKPANVMIRKDGQPFILDFGIAREIQETMTRVTGKLSSGTLLYMSPEQLRGLPPKPAQDVYSFAAMVYECMAGHPPFYRGAIEDQIKNEQPEPLEPHIAISGLVTQGLSKNPEDRPSTCMAVLDARSPVPRRVAEPRSNGVGKAFAFLLLLAALGAGGYYGWVKHDEALREKSAEVERIRLEKDAAERRLREESLRIRREAEERLQAERKAREEREKKAAEERIRAEKKEAEDKLREETARVRREAEEKLRAEREALERREKELAEEQARQLALQSALATNRLQQASEEERNFIDEERKRMAEAKLKEEARQKMEAEKQKLAAEGKAFMERLDRTGFILDGKANRYQPGTIKRIELGRGEELVMVWCPPGWFMMGSPKSEMDRVEGEVRHAVRLTKGFWIGKYEITKGQWSVIMGNSVWFGKNEPKSSVSWNNCKDFIKRVKSRTGVSVRLPTEAEWEYACRAGTSTPFSFGSVLNGMQACCNGGEPYGTTARGPANMSGPSNVGSFSLYANAWGINDMHGNVYEWCEDVFAEYPRAAGIAEDPMNGGNGEVRVIRGGCWNYSPRQCRSAFRTSGNPSLGTGMIGFRLVCDDLP